MKKEYFLRNSYFTNAEIKYNTEYCKQNCKEEVDHIMRIAEEAVRLEFLFDLRWDMERTFEPVIYEGKIDWSYMPKDDPEYVYQINRHRYWICLGQAYAMTGEEKFTKAFVEQITSWIDENPFNEKTKLTSWRSIEAGLRGEFWTKAIKYFKDSPHLTDELMENFCQVLRIHGKYIVDCYAPFQLQSNWGVIENSGLFAIALALPESEETKEWAKIAIERLDKMIQTQVMGDGVHWEQSPMYHNEVLHCYLEVVRLAKERDIELPSTILDITKKMVYVDLVAKKPNHCQITLGDSDETDVRDIITCAAYLYKDSVLKFGGYPIMDFENIWLFGKEGAKEYDELASKEPDFKAINLVQSGDCYIRSDWSENADFIHFRCGSLGGGHGHNDKLHIDLVINGEDILVDGGRYTYVAGDTRTLLKSAHAHNTVLVDDKDYMTYDGAWAVKGLCAFTKLHHIEQDSYHFMEAGHLGYQKDGIFINRKVIVINPKLYVIVDEIYGNDEHKYSQTFHFNNTGEVEMQGCCTRYIGDNAIADIWPVGSDNRCSIEDTEVSKHYNHKTGNKTLKINSTKKGFHSFITVISGYDKEEKIETKVKKIPVKSMLAQSILSDEQTEAIEIQKDGKTYTLVVGHKEIAAPTDLFKAGEHVGFGNVVLFADGKATTLRW